MFNFLHAITFLQVPTTKMLEITLKLTISVMFLDYIIILHFANLYTTLRYVSLCIY